MRYLVISVLLAIMGSSLMAREEVIPGRYNVVGHDGPELVQGFLIYPDGLKEISLGDMVYVDNEPMSFRLTGRPGPPFVLVSEGEEVLIELFPTAQFLDQAIRLDEQQWDYLDLQHREVFATRLTDPQFDWHPFGDSNLDGSFDSSDLVAVFQAGTYEANTWSQWATGDWDGDERFNSTDLVRAFQAGTYDSVATLPVVPEPTGTVTFLLALLMILSRPFPRSGH